MSAEPVFRVNFKTGWSENLRRMAVITTNGIYQVRTAFDQAVFADNYFPVFSALASLLHETNTMEVVTMPAIAVRIRMDFFII
jgi:hypothetical protein